MTDTFNLRRAMVIHDSYTCTNSRTNISWFKTWLKESLTDQPEIVSRYFSNNPVERNDFNNYYFAPGRHANYCEFAITMSVCLSTRISRKKHLHTIQNNYTLPPTMARSSGPPSFGWGKGGNVTSAEWQVTLCNSMWHVSSCSGVATLRTAIHLLLTFLLTP